MLQYVVKFVKDAENVLSSQKRKLITFMQPNDQQRENKQKSL